MYEKHAKNMWLCLCWSLFTILYTVPIDDDNQYGVNFTSKLSFVTLVFFIIFILTFLYFPWRPLQGRWGQRVKGEKILWLQHSSHFNSFSSCLTFNKFHHLSCFYINSPGKIYVHLVASSAARICGSFTSRPQIFADAGNASHLLLATDTREWTTQCIHRQMNVLCSGLSSLQPRISSRGLYGLIL